MLDEGMSRPRRPIFTPQTFRSVVGIKGNEFVLKNAFVRVNNDLYVFVMVMKLRHVCCLTGDKKVDRDRERGDKKVDLLTCDKKVSK